MKYSKIVSANFLYRMNRFTGVVSLNGENEIVHIKNTGRCRELLLPGSAVYLSVPENPSRKTKYDLVAVEKKISGNRTILINMDSQVPNHAVAEWLSGWDLFSSRAEIRREVFYKKSRFDFFIDDGDQKYFLEVKGVTLEQDGIAMFPDAPTERGVRHLRELESAVRDGFSAIVLFLIQMKGIREFRPNDITHPAFGEALRNAGKNGVKIMAFDSVITPDSITLCSPVPVNLASL